VPLARACSRATCKARPLELRCHATALHRPDVLRHLTINQLKCRPVVATGERGCAAGAPVEYGLLSLYHSQA
jgi:hypothetical protein